MSNNISREVITLQVGHYSNFIGSHWWNAQEASFVYDKNLSTDVEHDFLFREGYIPGHQESYTPRLLIIDKKGSLGSLKPGGNLYDSVVAAPSTSQALWEGQVDLVYQIPEDKNEFIRCLEADDAKFQKSLDEDKDICMEDTTELGLDSPPKKKKAYNLSTDVKVWSDFLRPHIHPKTIYLLGETYQYDEGEEGGGWGFQGGATVMKKEETQEEIFDRIRLLAESCGSLQGFQLLCDAHNGMGGVGWIVAQHLDDDYGSKDLFSFASTPPHYKSASAHDLSVYITSVVQCYTELSKLSSFLLPLNLRNHCWRPNSGSTSFPHLTYGLNNPYETSCIFGTFLDTITIPYRTKLNAIPMSHFGDLITPLQRKIVGGSLALPVGMKEDSFLFDYLIENNDFEFRSISSSCKCSLNPISEHRVIRGLGSDILSSKSTKLPDGIQFNNAWNLYEHFLMERQTNSGIRNTFGILDPHKTVEPFPRLFHKTINESGFIKRESHTSFLSNDVVSVPVAASLTQGDGIRIFLKELSDSVQNLDVAKIPRLIEEEYDQEAWNETKEDLRNLLEQYGLKDHQESSDDTDN